MEALASSIVPLPVSPRSHSESNSMNSEASDSEVGVSDMVELRNHRLYFIEVTSILQLQDYLPAQVQMPL